MRDGVGDHALAVEVRGREDVGDVAVHEDVAGLQAEQGRLGDARVGAADPEDLGLLARGEGGEEARVRVGGRLGPLLVLVQAVLEVICGRGGGGLVRCLVVFGWFGGVRRRGVAGCCC